MKERKCISCKLTYKGLKERCPFCHKLTKIGIFNKIMCVLGYISFAFWLAILAEIMITKTIIDIIWLAPVITVLIIIAIVVGICYLILK